jgi:hypothetical protein
MWVNTRAKMNSFACIRRFFNNFTEVEFLLSPKDYSHKKLNAMLHYVTATHVNHLLSRDCFC